MHTIFGIPFFTWAGHGAVVGGVCLMWPNAYLYIVASYVVTHILIAWTGLPYVVFIVCSGYCGYLSYQGFSISSSISLMPIAWMMLFAVIIDSIIRITNKQKEPLVVQNNIHQGTVLGTSSNNQEVFLSDHDANHHTLVVGTTGTGKTTAVCNIVESAITRKLPLFYVDGKGDLSLAQRVADFASVHDVPCYVFSMQGPSVRYNPLAHGGFTSQKDRVIALRNWSEEYYQKIAESYLQTVFAVLAQTDIHVDLYNLANYLDLRTLFLLARERKDQNMIDQLIRLEKYAKDISGLIADIDNLASSEIGHLFNCENHEHLTLEQAYQEKAVVYFCLSPLAFPQYADTLGKLIINDLKGLLSRNIATNRKEICYGVLDEFSVFAGDQVVNVINQGREAGMCAVLATQSLADIAIRGGTSLLGQILNNCNNYIIQRQNNPDDANKLADIIGTKNIYQHSTTFGRQQTPVSSMQRSRQYTIHPEQIKSLSKGQAIIVNKVAKTIWPTQIRKGAI